MIVYGKCLGLECHRGLNANRSLSWIQIAWPLWGTGLGNYSPVCRMYWKCSINSSPRLGILLEVFFFFICFCKFAVSFGDWCGRSVFELFAYSNEVWMCWGDSPKQVVDYKQEKKKRHFVFYIGLFLLWNVAGLGKLENGVGKWLLHSVPNIHYVLCPWSRVLKRTDLMLKTDLLEWETKAAVAGTTWERGFP